MVNRPDPVALAGLNDGFGIQHIEDEKFPIRVRMHSINGADVGGNHGGGSVFFSQSLNKFGSDLPQCTSDQDVVSWCPRHNSD